MEMVFWLLSMLANRDKEEMSRTLLALSSSQDSCVAMRKSGGVPLLVQILHEEAGGPGEACCSRQAKSRAGAALHNIIYSQQDEGQARREMRVLHMLEQVRTYCDSGWDWMENRAESRPGPTAILGEYRFEAVRLPPPTTRRIDIQPEGRTKSKRRRVALS